MISTFRGLACGLSTQAEAQAEAQADIDGACAGVSSFGYAGTIVHTALQLTDSPESQPKFMAEVQLANSPALRRRRPFLWREAITPPCLAST
eukprot:5335385-Prymnesium_polylepis.1